VTAKPSPDGQDASPENGPVPGVRPLAPVFVSYRTSDGSDLAAAVAWALRATGVPVWHDITDLPPGDTARRLQEALTAGLSGAALLITPDIQYSTVVRDIEVPGLLNLKPAPAFTFAIGSIVSRMATPGNTTAISPRPDYAAPTRSWPSRRAPCSGSSNTPCSMTPASPCWPAR
jgi:hypothetical protein